MTITVPAAAATDESAVPRPEYPRPNFERASGWATLNGTWEFRRGEATSATEAWEKITVPFAWETPASGIQAHWLERATYRRTFTIDYGWSGQRVILHFGAVHHEATVWVDGVELGTHRGGSTPFEFDITDALTQVDEHVLVVSVLAPNDKLSIVHGKQRSMPRDDYDGCAFTPSSGIWQTVWLEARPATHLAELRLRPSEDLHGILVAGSVEGPCRDDALVSVSVPGTDAAWAGRASSLSDGIALMIAEPRLWSPEDPHLYQVRVEVASDDGVDQVTSATGLRSFEAREGSFFLNGRRVSLRGVLDQGYWPETGITAPSDEAFVRDLELARQAGFNLVRKHLKLEDPRFHFHADRLGMLVWAEPASTGRFSAEATGAFSAQIEPMVRRDGNHPSIVVWGLYNEEWGLDWAITDDPAKQEVVRGDYRALKALDATRPVVDNSGWSHVETDVADWHIYDEHPAGWARKVGDLMMELSTSATPEFPVGIDVGVVVPKRLMADGRLPASIPFMNSEFGGGWTAVDRGWNLHWQTQELRRHDRIAGWIWTELYDVEHESAGIADADRIVKDHGGRPPHHANAETAAVFNVVPVAPGRDLVTATGQVAIEVAVSHHGAAPIDIDVRFVWGEVFGLEPAAEPRSAGSVHVDPFVLSARVPISTALPAGAAAARLHVLLSAAGVTVGRGAIDVTRR